MSPPLRERKADIPLLTVSFLKRLNRLYGKKIDDLASGVLDALLNYDWPGNIRELENLIHRAYILETTSRLTRTSFPRELFDKPLAPSLHGGDNLPQLAAYRQVAVEKAEKEYLRATLSTHAGRIDRTAATAGVSRRQIHKLMRKYGLRKEKFKQNNR